MNTRTQFEAQLEYKNIRRMRAEDKWLAKREKLEAKAKPFIGELNRYNEKALRCTTCLRPGESTRKARTTN